MFHSGFRPSDDECKYNFLVPANMFAVVALGYASEMAEDLWSNQKLAQKAKKLAAEVQEGLQNHAIVDHPKHGKIYAYEVDGLGNSNLMDDANVPSLMSLPYLGYESDPAVYTNTRKFVLSSDNPTYHSGSMKNGLQVEGYGSPHMTQAIKSNIWPMSIAMRGLTSDNTEEKLRMVDMLVQTTGGTGWMHESFDVSNHYKFTRKWFCWSDSLFAELVLSLSDACPLSSTKYKVHEWRDPVKVPGGRFAAEE
jgi:meiotically up-regulated gene 157 (Mug157) protein